MSVKGTIKEITKNVKGISKAGKEYTYTKFVYTTETGEEKTKQLFKDDVISNVKVGDAVEIFFKKNDNGFFDLVEVSCMGASSTTSAPKSAVVRSVSDKDYEIEVMNALNVASSLPCKTPNEIIEAAKAILDSKTTLVAYAKKVRESGTKESTSDSPFAN